MASEIRFQDDTRYRHFLRVRNGRLRRHIGSIQMGLIGTYHSRRTRHCCVCHEVIQIGELYTRDVAVGRSWHASHNGAPANVFDMAQRIQRCAECAL